MVLALSLAILVSVMAVNVYALGDFTISANPTSIAVNAGQSANSTITLISTGAFTGTISLSDSIAPSTGLTCSLSPSSVTLTLTTSSATSALSCSGSAGVYTVTITGASGTLSHSTSVTIIVKDFSVSASPTTVTVLAGATGTSTITVSPVDGFTGTVTLTASVSPSGLTCALSPSSITLGASQPSTLSCSGSAGTYTVTVTGTSGSLSHSTTVTYAVTDFSVSASPTSVTTTIGTAASSTITVAPVNSFTGTVMLSSAVSPAGLTCTLNPTSITLGASQTSNLSCSSSTATTYTVTVTGSGGSITHTTTVAFVVTDFTVSATPTSTTVNVGTAATSTITVAPVNGFTGTVTLTSSTNPSGLICTLTPNRITLGASQTSALSCTGTIANIYTVTVTGTSGSLSHTAAVTVTVMDYAVTPSPNSVTTSPGTAAASTITVAPVNGFTGTITLASTVSPSGLTCTLTPTSITLGGSQTSNLSCSGSSGTYTVTVTGTSGSITHTTTVTYNVQDFTITGSPSTVMILAGAAGTSTVTITAVNGFAGVVSLTATVSPATGLTCTLSPTSVTASGTSTLSCSGSAGSYTVTVTGTSGTESHTTTVTYAVEDFTIAASPNAVTVLAGAAGTSTITVMGLQAFSGAVSLMGSISPTGLTCTLLPTGLTGSGSSILSCNGTAGSYIITVTGTSSTLSHTTTVTYTVQDFTVSVGPATATVQAGSQASSIITVNAVNGFTGNVTLTQSVSPMSGIACSLNPTFLILGVSVTSSLSCTGSAGVYTVTVVGAYNVLSHSATATFTIEDFTLVASTNSVTVNAGSSGSETIVAVSLEGFSGTVNLAYTVVPSFGLSCQLAPASIILGTFGTANLACLGQAGTYTLIVTGSVSTLSHSLNTTYTVQDFAMSSNSTTLSLSTGSTISSRVTLTSKNQFSGTVSLAVDVSPSGLYCSLTPSSTVLTSSATSTLSCTGSTPGTYTVRVTATSGSIAQTSTFTVSEITPPQTIPLLYFAVLALVLGSGGAAALVVKKFIDTDAPFDEFFKIAGGEFQQPAVLLIIGDTGAGTSTLGLELVYRQLSAGKPCGLLTYDAFPSEVQKKMLGMGWDVAGNLKDGTLRIVDCYSALAGDEKAVIKDPLDLTQVSIQVTELIEKASNGPITILLDSVTPIFNSASAKDAINFFQVVGAKVKNQGGIFILAGTKGSIPEETRSKLEALVEGVIDLSLVRTGDLVKRNLTIKKMSGRKASLLPTEFRIVSGKGILFRKRRLSLRRRRGTRTNPPE
ncbi:MAG TPA: ATPase domain-containing protein [Candidatus Angelobacter sp.]|nr:ATPase domain-containing protein [Candidatus Angelobacter sp.]